MIGETLDWLQTVKTINGIKKDRILLILYSEFFNTCKLSIPQPQWRRSRRVCPTIENHMLGDNDIYNFITLDVLICYQRIHWLIRSVPRPIHLSPYNSIDFLVFENRKVEISASWV